MDYIKDLGFNTIYMNPIFTANEYHKYDLLDYFHIDPCFGTNNDFAELVDICTFFFRAVEFTAFRYNIHVFMNDDDNGGHNDNGNAA